MLAVIFVGLCPSPTVAVDSAAVDKATDFLKTACAAGDSLSIKVEGDGGISLLKKGLKGRLHFSKKDARGVVENLPGQLQREDLKDLRDCMRPYIDRMLDAILGQDTSTSSANPQLPPGFSVDGKGFILTPDKKRICKNEVERHRNPSGWSVIGLPTVCKLYDGTWSQE
jgi:hypothetical protein